MVSRPGNFFAVDYKRSAAAINCKSAAIYTRIRSFLQQRREIHADRLFIQPGPGLVFSDLSYDRIAFGRCREMVDPQSKNRNASRKDQ